MEWMLMPLKRYADFNGRSRRKEYWMFTLLNFLVYMVLYGIMIASAAPMAMTDGTSDAATMGAAAGMGVVGLILLVYALGVLIPSIAVTVRRFHDQDKSGWMVLLGLIPFVGGLILLVFMFMEGTRGPNQYGEDPKADENRINV